MLFELIVTLLAQSFSIAYAWLNQYLVSPFLTFTRGFEFAKIFSAAAIFFMISVFLLLKQAKKLPKSYVIEIEDIYGEKVAIDGVRQAFATHDAAESYARMYRDNLRQYKFRVVGVSEQASKS